MVGAALPNVTFEMSRRDQHGAGLGDSHINDELYE
jgi:hypothetical protein